MKDYQINTPVTLRDGIVRLSPDLTKGREHKLEPVKGKKDHYRIIGPNQFKSGQQIGYDGDLPKSMAVNMTEKSVADAAAKKAAAEAEKEAKKAAAEAEKARAKLEAEAKAEWEASAQLREQHGNDFNVYLAAVLEQLG